MPNKKTQSRWKSEKQKMEWGFQNNNKQRHRHHKLIQLNEHDQSPCCRDSRAAISRAQVEHGERTKPKRKQKNKLQGYKKPESLK